jgi:hypothetical protein
MTHGDLRHGTTTLFAALNVLDGTVIGRCGHDVISAWAPTTPRQRGVSRVFVFAEVH